MLIVPMPYSDVAQPPAPTAPIAPLAPLAQTGPATATEMWQAAKAFRAALLDQYDRLRETRASIAEATSEPNRTATDISGLEGRLKMLDQRLVDMEKQIASADAQVAQTAAQPGAVVEPPPRVRDTSINWNDVVAGGGMLSFALLFPFVIAYSRRIWRRSANVVVTLPPEVAARMQSMEAAIESVAVEVERIGEGQRFMTQALGDQPRFVGAGAAEPVMVRAREVVRGERPL